MMKEVDTPRWDNDLIMCPSQCYCYFEAEGQKFCIYLRWRHDDPWTAQLVPVDGNGQFIYDGRWPYLDVPDYVHDGYENLQRQCIRIIEDTYKKVRWFVKPIKWY